MVPYQRPISAIFKLPYQKDNASNLTVVKRIWIQKSKNYLELFLVALFCLVFIIFYQKKTKGIWVIFMTKKILKIFKNLKMTIPKVSTKFTQPLTQKKSWKRVKCSVPVKHSNKLQATKWGKVLSSIIEVRLFLIFFSEI